MTAVLTRWYVRGHYGIRIFILFIFRAVPSITAILYPSLRIALVGGYHRTAVIRIRTGEHCGWLPVSTASQHRPGRIDNCGTRSTCMHR